MPRFWSPNGPYIPDEVDQAIEDETLVLFCGAGVSMAAGLCDFKGLVKALYKGLNVESPPNCDPRWSWPDRLLGQLEQDYPGVFREKLCSELTRNPKTLAMHKAILRIARLKDQRVRLVTTNFDLYFENAWRHLGWSLEEHEGPALPIPQSSQPHDWGSIVYLHGKLKASSANSHLVVTSADFGRAYLREAWAARFATHLLSAFSVLFVGYSLNDPVLRYIVDAFAADRSAGRVPHQAYALIGTLSGREEGREQWAGMGIRPIYYDNADHHQALYETLRIWAEWRNDRLSAKEQAIAVTLQAVGSATMPAHVRENLLWALAGGGPDDPFGAAVLANRAADTPGHWIAVFQDHDVNAQRSRGALSASGPATLLAGLCGTAEGNIQPSLVEEQIARWIVAHLNDRSVLDWARGCWNAGHRIGARLRRMIRQELAQKPPKAPFARLWQLLSAESLQPQAVDGQLVKDVLLALRQNDPSPELIREMCWLLEPVLVLDEPFDYPRRPDDRSVQQPDLNDLVLPRVELRGTPWLDMLFQSVATSLDHAILATMTEHLTDLTGRALDLWAALGQASAVSDPGTDYLRCLGTSMLYRATEEWTLLADLLWAGWKELDRKSASASRAVVAQWQAKRYPMFRGLAVMAVTNSDRWNTDQKGSVLFSELSTPALNHQILPLLAVCAVSMTELQRQSLTEAILAIKPTDVSDADDPEAECIRDFVVLLRLEKFAHCMAGSLPPKAMTELTRLRARRPEFTLEQFEQSGLPKLIGTTFAPPEPVYFKPAESVCSRTNADLLELLRAQERQPDIAVIDWRISWQKCPEDTLMALEISRSHGTRPADMWAGALRAVSSSLDENNIRKIFDAVLTLPGDLLREPTLLRDASRFLADHAKWGHAGINVDVYWVLWDKLIANAIDVSIGRTSDDPLVTAKFDPAGALAEALIRSFDLTQPRRQQLLASPWRARFDKLLGSEAGLRSAHVVLAYNLAFVHSVDRDWTVPNILRRMDYGVSPDSGTAALWQAYGLGLRLDLDLWNDLREPFTTLIRDRHLDELGLESRRNILYVPVLLAQSSLVLSSFIADTRPIVAALPPNDRDAVAEWMRRAVAHESSMQPDGAAPSQNRADEIVHERLLPWLEAVWPCGQLAHTDSSTLNLIGVALACGAQFPDVCSRLRPFLGKLELPAQALMMMEGTRHPDDHPAAVLHLIDHVADPEHVTSREPLTALVARIERQDGTLQRDPVFLKWNNRGRVLRNTQSH